MRLVSAVLAAAFLLAPFPVVAETVSRPALPAEPVFKKMLDNGLTILVRPVPSSALVAISIRIRAGSVGEGPYAGSGISHFVEHMVFKGTTTRAAGAIVEEVKSYGGIINASSDGDLTTYKMTVLAAYAPQAIELFKDMLRNAAFDEGEFRRERDVILSEMRLLADRPSYRGTELLSTVSYRRHPYRLPVIGYRPIFETLTRDDLMAYYRSRYVPNRMVIAVVGAVDPAAMTARIADLFGDGRPQYAEDAVPVEEPQTGLRWYNGETSGRIAHLFFGFHGTDAFHEDMYALDLLALILARGDDARLVRRLVKETRLAYAASSGNETGRYPGLFTITLKLDGEKAPAAEALLRAEIETIRESGVTEAELARAKTRAVSDFIFSSQSIEAQASRLSIGEIITGDYDFDRRYLDAITRLSREDLRRVARLYLVAENLSIVRLFPTGAATTAALPAPKTAAKK